METPNTPDMSGNAINAPSHFGKLLQDARHAKGLTIEQASDTLKIMKRHLQALEAEDYEALPPGAFSRGFLVNYAKFLGLNPTEVTQIFDSHYPAHLKPKSPAEIKAPLQPMGTLNRESRGRIKINPWLIGGIILALVIGGFIIKSVNKARNEAKAQTASAPIKTDTITPQDRATGASLANTGSAVANVGSAVPNAGSALSSTGSVIGTVTATAQMDVLVKDTTTVTITDAAGKSLLQGEQTKGSYKVSGQPPFNVVIDNIKNVNIDLNKQPIKLSNYTTTNQANFTLK